MKTFAPTNTKDRIYCPFCRKTHDHTRHRDSTGRYVYTCPHCGRTQVYNN